MMPRRPLRSRPALLAALALMVTLAAPPAAAQVDTAWEQVWLDWDAGDYVPALEGMIALMKGEEAADYLERVALLSGELFQVTELAPDGGGVGFSPDGRWAYYQVGPRNEPVVHILSVNDGFREVAALPGNRSASVVEV